MKFGTRIPHGIHHNDYPVVVIRNDENSSKQKPLPFNPDGSCLSLKDLPPANTKRWVSSRKAQIVAAINGDLISVDEACKKYALSPEELISWQEALKHQGLAGLKVTKSRNHRR
ncbi:MAG: DUF1153 domain-containing protein [Alphaproteobacteria bacterium]|jgi:hypothetical protein|nr:DUF1153 domain-containing protein [Alphaproteobacteria bacterium]MBP9878160.1 DUF1153 domain-containing protein [Alphaproteobacteria bacterium]